MVRGLLATLVLRKNTVVSREALASALWDRPPESAEVNLRQYAMDLRRQLSHVDDGLAERLRTVREVGYELVLGDRESDYDEFYETWRDARTFLLAGVFRLAAGWLWLAVNMWRGAVGADTPTGGRLERRLSALQEQYLAAEEDLAAAQIALGEGPVVVETLTNLLAEYPGRERAAQLLMLAEYRSGSVIGALDAYSDFRAALTGEFGVEPGEALRDLHQTMLRRDDDGLLDNQLLIKMSKVNGPVMVGV